MNYPVDFTNTELEVIKLTCEDQLPDDIAIKMGLSKNTMEAMTEEIIKKMGVRNEVGILWYALKYNLWKPA